MLRIDRYGGCPIQEAVETDISEFEDGLTGLRRGPRSWIRFLPETGGATCVHFSHNRIVEGV